MRISDWSSDVCSSDLIITREKWAKQGKQMGETDEKMLAMIRKNIVDQFDRESHAFAATARLFDDGLIDPRDTRKVLGLCLSVCRVSKSRELFANRYGVAQIGRAACRDRVGQYV